MPFRPPFSTTTASPDAQDEDAPISKRQKLWAKVRTAPLWPVMLAFGAGYKIGIKVAAKRALSAAGTAATEAAEPTTASTRIAVRTVFLATALAALVMREVWRSIPVWLKRQLPWVGRRRLAANEQASAETSSQELTSVGALSARLSGLFSLASEKLKVDDEDVNIQAALLASLQLVAQLKKNHSLDRDESYDEIGEAVKDPTKELEGLDEAFEFADWAYDELPEEQTLKEALARHNFSLLRHDKVSLPGTVAHYVALSKERKLALVGIKGTSNFEDLLTDCCGQAIEETLPGPFVPDGPSAILCHDGILSAARNLADEVELLLEELLLPNGYKLLITGHSLGAGTAALLAVLLRARFPQQLLNDKGNLLKVLAFAPPPILDLDSALACSSFCTSIINNSDVIPRASLSNLAVLLALLKTISRRLQEKGANPKDLESTAAYFSMVTKGTDGDMLMTADEYKVALDEAIDSVELKDPNHLYVPGRVLHLYDLWSKNGYGVVNEETGVANVRTAERVRIADGSSKRLRHLEMDASMIS